ncbi:hypothetical protein Syn7502_01185 [Synechococcus sp. PCC 7502]|uniref:Uma2 family endonuclease n=1 Tax=Synechococcus sp. PCC 7502 TaxID=1173263 RepID=UPI00029F8B5B|nr:Uma2 family endonuclease [Synechococcus sp. PCC 7502]AFY73288.1 hypothetical protein Syn7502_01185 [Synechococcus sp. PCC 7502]
MESITLNLKPTIDLTPDQLFEVCQQNRDVRIERSSNGELVIMPPTGFETGNRNSDLIYQLQAWNRQYKLGKVCDSSTGFILPNGAERSPDASWLKLERLAAFTLEQRQKFLPLCPDFVVELRSPTDSLKPLQVKMQEYIDNDCQMGWLIDPKQRTVEIYRPNQVVQILQSPISVSGENILPNFVLELSEIFTNN